MNAHSILDPYRSTVKGSKQRGCLVLVVYSLSDPKPTAVPWLANHKNEIDALAFVFLSAL